MHTSRFTGTQIIGTIKAKDLPPARSDPSNLLRENTKLKALKER